MQSSIKWLSLLILDFYTELACAFNENKNNAENNELCVRAAFVYSI